MPASGGEAASAPQSCRCSASRSCCASAPGWNAGASPERPATFTATTVGAAVTIVAARLVFWFAVTPLVGTRPLTSPLDLLLTAMAVTAIVWVALDSIERWRLAGPRPRLLLGTAEVGRLGRSGVHRSRHLAATILWRYERLLDAIASQTPLDLVQFSLQPLNAANAPRIALASVWCCCTRP